MRPPDEDAWQEFVRRYHRTIRNNVLKTFNLMALRESDRRAQFPKDSIDDLVQAVYLHLVKDSNHALNRFKGRYEESIYRYLGVISINVVRDHFREIRALKRPKITLSLEDLVNADGVNEGPSAVYSIDGEPVRTGTPRVTMEQIDAALEKVTVGKHRSRDMLIYKLRYLDGLTLEEIRNVLGLEMSGVSIGSLISRLNDKLRKRLSRLT